MEDGLRRALELLVAKGEAGDLCDRWVEEGGFQSEDLENALAVIAAALAQD